MQIRNFSYLLRYIEAELACPVNLIHKMHIILLIEIASKTLRPNHKSPQLYISRDKKTFSCCVFQELKTFIKYFSLPLAY